ncbi:hypothetical protein N867_07545 [Actinotalea fermentans ATCC 43279 = JCM 9966 = DSM 3133]|nr:hypothetical protein N867_07545 [Actinotalea fermentans ATCC 43279 = JCM 9966 = DSM 3133]
MILGVLGVVLTALVTILAMRGCRGSPDDADATDDVGAVDAAATDAGATTATRSATSAVSPGSTDAPGPAGAADDTEGDEGAAADAGDVPADEGGPGEEGAAAGAGDVPTETLPLWDPGERPDSVSSDVPMAGEDLVEGDYFVQVTGFHPIERFVSFDVQQLLLGEAAVQYLLVHDPTAEIPPPNGYVLVNESDAIRSLDLADDARLWDWCYDGGALSYAERTFDEWVDAFFDGWSQECSAGADLGHGAYLFWLQVREGEVQRVIGQYLP